MLSRHGRVLAGLALSLSTLPATAVLAARQEVDEDKIDLRQVPASVLKVVQKAVPTLRPTFAYKDVDEGETTYEVCGRDAEGREVEVEITAKGVVQGVETTIPAKQVPKVIIQALRAKARGIHFEKAEVVTLDGQIIGYEFEGENAQGDEVEVTVSPDGRSVEIEELDDE